MLKKLYRIFIALIVVCCPMACKDSFDVPTTITPDSPGSITIRFFSSEMSRSVASDNSEILIDNIHIGLYPLDASDTDAAIAWTDLSYLGAKQSKVVTMNLNDAMATALFDNSDGKECRIFALANVPEDIEVPKYASVETLRSLSIQSDFDNGDVQPSFIMTGENKNIRYYAPTVQGQKGKAVGTVVLKRTAAKIKLNVTVPETIEIKDEAGNVKETWHPRKTNDKVLMNVSLKNGVNQATAIAAEKPANKQAYFDSDLSELSLIGGKYVLDVPFYTYPNSWTENIDETHKTVLSLMVPWYKDGGDSNATTTFYYQVPLTPAEVTKLESNHSYTVNLTVGMLGSLVPDTPVTVENVSYQIVNWGDGELEIPIEESRYLVVNPNVYTFNNETNMSIPYYTSHPVEIVDVKIRYQRFNFVSDPDNPEVGEVVTFTIDESQIDDTNIKYVDTPLCLQSLSETSGQKYLNIYHPLNLWIPYDSAEAEVPLTGYNAVSDTTMVAQKIKYYSPIEEDAFSKYIITCTLRHKDQPEYKEDITIFQYPAIYIEADRNPADKPEGNVFVNGYTNVRATSQNGAPSYGSTTGLTWGDANNKNPNMYIINITSLSDDIEFYVEDEETGKTIKYNYVIGDPRSKFWTNRFKTTETQTNLWTNQKTRTDNSEPTTKSWCIPALALYTAPDISSTYTEEDPFRRTLAYYYITLEDGSVTNMVAPQIRVASSWGVTSSISRVYARYRAALYQENAYPAGRWRMPTVAEFCYINKLSSEEKIPQLFTYNVPYWTSDGLYRGTKDGKIYRDKNQAQNRAVRAVYDEWYWSQYPQFTITPDENGEYTFTLGDVPRGVQ